MERTQHMGPSEHGWSQKLYMHVNGLIIIVFNILIKTWSIKIKDYKHSYDHYVYAYALDLGHTY